MLFLVISSPTAARPDEIKAERRQFRAWIKPLRDNGRILTFYPMVGRGSVVIFDVPSNEDLHVLLTQWANIVPASFEIRALVNPGIAENQLA